MVVSERKITEVMQRLEELNVDSPSINNSVLAGLRDRNGAAGNVLLMMR